MGVVCRSVLADPEGIVDISRVVEDPGIEGRLTSRTLEGCQKRKQVKRIPAESPNRVSKMGQN